MGDGWHDTLAELRGLVESDPADRAGLEAWNEKAAALERRIQPRVSDRLAHEVWHFLSDADLRVKDVDYARVQRDWIRGWLEKAEAEPD